MLFILYSNNKSKFLWFFHDFLVIFRGDSVLLQWNCSLQYVSSCGCADAAEQAEMAKREGVLVLSGQRLSSKCHVVLSNKKGNTHGSHDRSDAAMPTDAGE